jgi:hypothetical protein
LPRRTNVFFLGHKRVIDIILPTQGDRDGVPLGIRGVAFEQVIGSDRDRNFFALIDLLSAALHAAHVGTKKWSCHLGAQMTVPCRPLGYGDGERGRQI